MAIYHIAYHGYKRKPTMEEAEQRLSMFNAAFSAAPYIEEGNAGRYLGNPEDGYDDAAWVKFKDIEAYGIHMRAPHGPDEANSLRETVARVRSFDIITPDEPADTPQKIIELYKQRWELFPDVAKVLREEVDASFPYL
ncbi:hypothetical protein [Segniliparus rugosus]|uniref:Uncharacterized protein n=1 Tax=Segniliparus rugosus (strain ATCC BAA-974 / DSM 45345 / CCUG 50838 / CIP 108380 / JCM 13579 / CDC 945) TaxID=679197 RepID=E5XPA1_SEGRC|nr:hypothetical protein [Segniliparus rugosus]EFV13826.2 hypothetical protein HMPREF9336_01323 [Segniliparus rugosus ATCC BAA-974]